MALRGFTRNFKPLEVLTDEQVEAIHKGTMEVLWGSWRGADAGWTMRIAGYVFHRTWSKTACAGLQAAFPPGPETPEIV